MSTSLNARGPNNDFGQLGRVCSNQETLTLCRCSSWKTTSNLFLEDKMLMPTPISASIKHAAYVSDACILCFLQLIQRICCCLLRQEIIVQVACGSLLCSKSPHTMARAVETFSVIMPISSCESRFWEMAIKRFGQRVMALFVHTQASLAHLRNHCLALTQKGALFAWGQNRARILVLS